MTPTEITDLYVEHGAEIFNPVSGGGGLIGPKYSPDALIKYLGEEFEKTHLSDINASGDKAELLVPSYAIGLPVEIFRPATPVCQCFSEAGKHGEFCWRLAQQPPKMISD